MFIRALENQTAYPHPTTKIQLIETHISWIFLTGTYAYKIKKPINLEFLDFSSLEKRKFYCQEEVKLNRLLAPEIYLDVVTIHGTSTHPHIEGEGPIIEYAIKMHQFSQQFLFSKLIKEKKLSVTQIDELAELIAVFHQNAAIATADSCFGSPEQVHAPVMQNFDQIEALLKDQHDKQQIIHLRYWAESFYQNNYLRFEQRKAQGFIRDCHGDLHLNNIVLYQQRATLFDRIEFNDNFRWTDVLADIAFLAMDLLDRKQKAFAYRLISAYFTHTQDYEGLALLPYYISYRAMVRAKISLFRSMQPNLSTVEKEAVIREYHGFIHLAAHYTKPAPQPFLAIMHGLVGSGKSSLARALVEKSGAIHISSDISRKKLFKLAPQARTKSKLYEGIYSVEATKKTYQFLYEIAQQIISAEYAVIVDATFLKQEQRCLFQLLAQSLSVPFYIFNCQASQEQLKANIKKRITQNNDPSEADLDVLYEIEKTAEPLTTTEKKFAFNINTANFNIDILDTLASETIDNSLGGFSKYCLLTIK